MNLRDREPLELEVRVRELLGAGDLDGAATAVIEALGPGVLRQLLGVLGPGDGPDAFSRLQEDVWRGLPGFQWQCSLRAWVYCVAWHAAARLVRDGYRRRRRPLPTHLASGLAAPASASGMGGRRDRLSLLRDELLPEEQNLLDLRVGRELEWDEVAALLAAQGEEVSAAALRKRFERLKRKLAGLARARGLL